MNPDPFSMVYTRLMDMVSASPLITQLVKSGNLIRYDIEANRSPIKQNIITSDVPELVLATNGLSQAKMTNTSSTSMCVHRYTWLLSTGDFRVNAVLNKVSWALFVSMLNWRAQLTSLEYPDGYRFVKRADFLDVTEGTSDPERNRGIKGMSALWQCEVEMHFRTQDLLDLLSGS